MWKFAAITAIAGLSVTACTRGAPGTRSFFLEAGSLVDSGSEFGAATANNTGIQTGQISYAVSLAKRFNAEVPSTINFAFNSSDLDEAARATLRQQAIWIAQFPEIQFRVFGHTDAVGSHASNKRLGLRRANAAVNYLISQGIERNRLEAVTSLGETQPLIATQERERQNRRTLTEVSGFVQRNQSVLDGKYAEIISREYKQSGTYVTNLVSEAAE